MTPTCLRENEEKIYLKLVSSNAECFLPLQKGLIEFCEVVLKDEILNPDWNLKCNINRKNILIIFIFKELLIHPVKEICKEYEFQAGCLGMFSDFPPVFV